MPTDHPATKPRRCVVTKLGLLAMGLAVAAFLAIYVAQYFATGSFDRGRGFVLGWLGRPMMAAMGLGLVLLLVGSVVDAARYSAQKKLSRAADR